MNRMPSVDELLWSWPTVCKAVANEPSNNWAKNFVFSISRQSRRRDWRPSEKQRALMSRMVNEVYRQRGDFDGIDDFEVIE